MPRLPQQLVMLSTVLAPATQEDCDAALGGTASKEQLARLAKGPQLYLGAIEHGEMAPHVRDVLELLGPKPRVLDRQLAMKIEHTLAQHNFSNVPMQSNITHVRTWLADQLTRVIYSVHWTP